MNYYRITFFYFKQTAGTRKILDTEVYVMCEGELTEERQKALFKKHLDYDGNTLQKADPKEIDKVEYNSQHSAKQLVID